MNRGKVIGLTGLMIAVGSGALAEKKSENKPNIIYILADDLGYGDISCYGQKHYSTPNIDRMAAEGMMFTQHYAGSALSAPSRCALMTGMHTGHARIRANFSATDSRVGLKTSDITIPELLKTAGYHTGMFGKWGLGELGTEGTPTRKGFDEFFGYVNQKHAHFYYFPCLQHNEDQVLIPENVQHRSVYTHDLIHSKAKEYITEQANAGKPFFAYLAYTLPHSELDVPEDDLSKFRGKFPETPYHESLSKGYRAQSEPKAAFAAMVSRLDRHVGEILSMLKELGIEDNTIVVFTSDNGPHDAGGADPLFFNGNAGMRGIKRDLYEGGISEPMIVKWSGTIKAGAKSDHLSAFWDVMPTLCEIADIETPRHCDGTSFLPTLKGMKQSNDRTLYWELGEKSLFKQAVRMGNYKAVRYGLKNKVQIYDISKDRKEQNDIATSNPELVAKALELFSSMRHEDLNFPMKDNAKTGRNTKSIDPDDQ